MSVLLDVNLLVYAALPSSSEHEMARIWLEERFADRDSFVALTWSVLYGFMRLVSSRRVVGDEAIGPAQAWEAADAFRLQPTTRVVAAGETHADVATELMSTPGLSPNDIPDVFLAAVAIEHGLILCSHDHGFARFYGLRWTDPLAVR
ncbi:MAG: PIN domain-containing protein [Acidimicrobiia bacterium]|nr:PIN domain-containing protein [Acidimicrobiia bacterium]